MLVLQQYCWIARPIEEIFEFFADAANLHRLVPPRLRLRVLTPLPVSMQIGTILDCSLRIHGLPVRWRSVIAEWDPPQRFVDEQRRGPYRDFIHIHEFVSRAGGTEVHDSVLYEVYGGRWIDRWLVRPELQRIFAYRRQRLSEIFDAGPVDRSVPEPVG